MVREPGLSPKCQLFFDRFVNRANKRSPYPDDWELFFDFIRVSHKQESEMKSTDLYSMLIKAGFPQGPAQQLSFFYKQGWSLLNRPDGYDQIPDD